MVPRSTPKTLSNRPLGSGKALLRSWDSCRDGACDAASYLTLTTAANATLTLTAGHHVPVGAACCSELKLAKDVLVGDSVWAVQAGNDKAVATTVVAIAATKPCCRRHSSWSSEGHAIGSSLFRRQHSMTTCRSILNGRVRTNVYALHSHARA